MRPRSLLGGLAMAGSAPVAVFQCGKRSLLPGRVV